MSEVIQIRNATLYVGDVLSVLRTLPSDSVHCCVTSPPYWGLRAYGTEPQVWGGDEACEHEFVDASRKHPLDRGGQYGGEKQYSNVGTTNCETGINAAFCRLCSAWRGELGSEPTIDLFVSHLVEVFREVRRVLHPSGVCWVNLGDSYAAQRGATSMPAETLAGGVGGKGDESAKRGRGDVAISRRNASAVGLKHKDLCLVPWRFVLAAQADGWWVRDCIVWHKPAPMPESVRDRCTKAWEPIFMLTKAANYYWDAEAVKEASDESSGWAKQRANGFDTWLYNDTPERIAQTGQEIRGSTFGAGGRNLRNVWKLTTEPEPAAHFACFPSGLPERCIKAGTSEKGCCPKCLKPWERVVERGESDYSKRGKHLGKDFGRNDSTPGGDGHTRTANGVVPSLKAAPVLSTLWRPSCTCGLDQIPCTVLDPFAGSGTTLKVAEQLGRRSIGIELSATYAHDIAVPKIRLALTDRSDNPALKPLKGQKTLL